MRRALVIVQMNREKLGERVKVNATVPSLPQKRSVFFLVSCYAVAFRPLAGTTVRMGLGVGAALEHSGTEYYHAICTSTTFSYVY